MHVPILNGHIKSLSETLVAAITVMNTPREAHPQGLIGKRNRLPIFWSVNLGPFDTACL